MDRNHDRRRLRKLPKKYVPRALRIETEIQKWVRQYGKAGLRTGVIRIPVVVHVIYNRANKKNENIRDSQIHSQIKVLNADFRRLNADADETPGVFRGVAADARLEFALAVRDPRGRRTKGITRTRTRVRGWNPVDHRMKAKKTGGRDPWDVRKYLNIWVVHNLGDEALGYGTRPHEPAKVQGVVLDYRAFGTIGTKFLQNAECGRTATHEIGHWLDLIHIWGSDQPSCADSDNVRDTPNQKAATDWATEPNYPKFSCSKRGHGDMFMNFMDYSGDKFRNMFTAGQVERMYATLYTQRAGILDSHGLVPPIAKQDLWIKNGLDDVGAEPAPSTQPMYASDDIWVRTTRDGLSNQDHDNPVHRPGKPNYVYVRVRNRGRSKTGAGTVKLYWAKASTGLSWPSPWDGSDTKLGGPIGSQKVKVKPGESKILEFPWSPPNPEDYAAVGADRSFALLARIETSDGMRCPETDDLWANVRKNNKIAWKSVTIVNGDPREAQPVASVIVANFRPKAHAVTLFLRLPTREPQSILEWGQVFVALPPSLIAARKSAKCSGVQPAGKHTFELVEREAELGTFELAPGAMHPLCIRLVRKPSFQGVHVLTCDLVQQAGKRVVGGQRIVIKTPPDDSDMIPDAPPRIFDGVKWVPAVESVQVVPSRVGVLRRPGYPVPATTLRVRRDRHSQVPLFLGK